jgi:thiosulfate/3-mercaptopyruvate sulfurtransferase
VEEAVPAEPPATKPDLAPVADRLATKEQILESLVGASLQIVDARSAGEFCGDEKLKNQRAGAIPGAKHLEWDDLLDPETGKFLPAPVLSDLFANSGVDLAKPTATHCQSGGRSSVMAFGMELMGAEHVRNYYRSWQEWGNAADTPVEKGVKQP